MQNTCRQRWNRHVDEKLSTERREAIENWEYFKKWTISLIRNSATLQSDTMAQLERARQRPGQDPREFHAYLDTLERHFARKSEDDRALAFFAKLLPELRRYIQEHILILPTTRDEMVTTASHYWNLLGRKRKRRTEDTTPEPEDRQRSRPNKDNASKGRRNPKDRYGNHLRCYKCDSEEHLANRCPQRNAKIQSIQANSDSETSGNTTEL
jgi:hypothetical protein